MSNAARDATLYRHLMKAVEQRLHFSGATTLTSIIPDGGHTAAIRGSRHHRHVTLADGMVQHGGLMGSRRVLPIGVAAHVGEATAAPPVASLPCRRDG
jgi:hypothetical protein